MTTTTNKRPPLPTYKERLWLNAQSNLLDFNKTLIEIIEQEAWTPTYDTFTDAYAAKLGNISFARELLPHIMYAMFNEGATVEQVVDAVKGVGADVAERVKNQKDTGVPADKASVTVRKHKRKLPGPWRWLRLKVDGTKHQEWALKAHANNTTIADVVLSAADAAFAEMQ